MALRHGGHQVAQKSINTNLPFVLGSAVSHFSTTNSGAFWPITDLAQSFLSSATAEATKPAQTTNTKRRDFIERKYRSWRAENPAKLQPRCSPPLALRYSLK